MRAGAASITIDPTSAAPEPEAVVASHDHLVLHRPVAELPEPLRSAVAGWLTDHGIDPRQVALGVPVVRHEDSRSLSWRENRACGRVVHRTFPAVPVSDLWPAPFPRELREAVAPPSGSDGSAESDGSDGSDGSDRSDD